MNLSMWQKALQVIPRISKEEWDHLDVISRWLISTRAAVLIMTFLSAAIAGILAVRDGQFNLLNWVLLVIGLVMAHATNNLINDFTDFVKGVDKDNYYRAQYGPQPLVHGLLNKRELGVYILVTGLIALAAGAVLVVIHGLPALLLLLAGAFFVLFYTFPLKYIGLGEVAVLIVWGPLMIGGGYYVITGEITWNVIIAGLVYALGVTTVLFGKHVDKEELDRAKRIYTLPVVMGEKASRYAVLGMTLLQYAAVAYLVLTGFFTPLLLVVFLALPAFFRILPMFRQPKPAEKPADFPEVWPNYFVAGAFFHNRRFGSLYLLGLILDTAWLTLIRPLIA
jgi:1,4-dihydroxy-2-naphthoate polyprenyltransferase